MQKESIELLIRHLKAIVKLLEEDIKEPLQQKYKFKEVEELNKN